MINAHWLSSGKQSVKVFSRFSVWKKQSRQSTEFSISAQKWVTTNIKRSKMKNGVGYSCKKVKGGLYSQWPKGSGVTSHHFLWVTRTTIPPFLSWNSKSCSRTKVAIHHVCTYVKCYSRISILSCHPNGFQRHNLFGHQKVFFLEKILLNARQNWSK